MSQQTLDTIYILLNLNTLGLVAIVFVFVCKIFVKNSDSYRIPIKRGFHSFSFIQRIFFWRALKSEVYWVLLYIK